MGLIDLCDQTIALLLDLPESHVSVAAAVGGVVAKSTHPLWTVSLETVPCLTTCFQHVLYVLHTARARAV